MLKSSRSSIMQVHLLRGDVWAETSCESCRRGREVCHQSSGREVALLSHRLTEEVNIHTEDKRDKRDLLPMRIAMTTAPAMRLKAKNQ